MHKRVAVLGFSHETNMFSPLRTEYPDFVNGGLFRGEELRTRFEGSRSVVWGFIQAAEECGYDVVPLFFARAEPLGPIANTAADTLIDELLSSIDSDAAWDGVLLALHGAAVSETERDIDGLIVTRVRQTVGDEVAVGVVFDMHANVSSRMIENSTFSIFYRTNPHLDAFERGMECGRLMGRVLNGKISPVQEFVRIPLIIGITRSDTSMPPMRDILKEMEACLENPAVLSASVVEGFPWADVPEMGMSVVVVADSDRDLARSVAERLADGAWGRRLDMIDSALSPEQAMTVATVGSYGRGPVGVLDVGDNIGGGGGGDSTVLLSIAIDRGISGVVTTMFDPAVAGECIAAGAGATLDLVVGGRIESGCCEPVRVHGTVAAISDGRFQDAGATHEGYRFFDAGPTAVLELENDIRIVVTSRRIGNVSQMQFRSVGIRPEEQQILILKGVNAPRGSFRPVCSEFILADTPGSTSMNLRHLDYRHIHRPIFPLDEDTVFG